MDIMKRYIILPLALGALALSSCDDFIDREPLDFGDEDAYFKNDQDLEMSANKFYEYLPQNKNGWGGLYTADTESDNQVSTDYVTLFYQGDKRTPKVEDSEWNFSKLRNINFFINKTLSVQSALKGNKTLCDHYLGEGYFFRAYEHFRLLRNFGDAPIVTEMQTDDRTALAENSKRYPRNEVARFILEDLDRAIALMQDYAPESGRAARGAAYALKSRVALYEATWEKYHAGTCFVPGNSKWPGASAWPEFSFKAGSAEAEINFFLDQAIEAADKAIALHPVTGDINDYMAMFNSTGQFANDSEVILARYYLSGVISHSCSGFLKSGGGCGVTRAAVNTFLMTSGLPIYADNSYPGDRELYQELTGRDLRLTNSVRNGGMEPDGTIIYAPVINGSSREKATTGYELVKWLSDAADQQVQYACTTAVPLFRSGECMLNYLEAYYLRYGNLGGNCDSYWKTLRTRAGVDTDYRKTINATDLNQENDLAVWSKGVEVDATLYNIRRERRCELLAEGLRQDDLKRWRSLDKMVNYQPEGFNLWDEMYRMYSASARTPEIVSQAGVSKYIHPLQIQASSVVYNGYTFPKPHYLEPIPISEFLLTGGIGNSTIYQNPGWPTDADGTAIYSYNCD